MKNYTIGIDYGTLSARVALVDCENGNVITAKEFVYPHAIMEKYLPDGTPLDSDWALQAPEDYLIVLSKTLPDVILESKILPENIKGVCVDFTACTIIPVLSDGTPLSFLEKYKSVPHAYTKLWKHHAAQKEADFINDVATKRGEKWFSLYGSKISCEFAHPKILQILHESPEIYEKADYFIDAGDWIVWQLSSNQVRSSCIAGYKYLHTSEGYPTDDFNIAIDRRLENLNCEKFNAPIMAPGQKAGTISEKAAKITGLKQGTAVAVAMIDAHAAAPALKIASPGKLFAILGTSCCYIIMGEKTLSIPGICGVVDNGTMIGKPAYEAGQSCYGDCFAWLTDKMVPESYHKEAKELNISVHELLTRRASKMKPGQSGLLALEWFNGNRSILTNSDLSGMILGINLQTAPEEIYRALMEATSFGARIIIDNFKKGGIAVDAVYASGGIATKNKVLLQMLSDVLNLPIYISATSQGGAVGSAIYAAVASGIYENLELAAEKMGSLKDYHYEPNTSFSLLYDTLYEEYVKLHDYFGKGGNDIMMKLKEFRK